LDDVYEEISRAHALLHPALHEAFGQVCLESLALGVPVICLNWGGPGLIVDEATGIAVEPGNRAATIERLAHAVCQMAAEQQANISRMAACRRRAFACFRWEDLAAAIVDRYRLILQRKT